MRCFSKIHRGIATSFTQNNTIPKTITVTNFLRYCEKSAKKNILFTMLQKAWMILTDKKKVIQNNNTMLNSQSNAKILRDWSESKTFNVLSLLLSYYNLIQLI